MSTPAHGTVGKTGHGRLHLAWHLLKATGEAWVDNQAARLGAALSFYSVLSLAPLLLLVLTAATAIWGREAAQGNIEGQMTSILGTEGAEAVQNILSAAAQHKDAGPIATLIGIVTLLFSASSVFGELRDSMNKIWKAPPRQGRAFFVMLRERFAAFVMVLACGLLMLLSPLLTAFFASLSKFVDVLPGTLSLMKAAGFALSFGITTLLFALTFKTVPDIEMPWKSVWGGAALTAALFIIGKILIALYVARMSASSTYGAAGSLIVLLVWVYYSAQIFFFGAEFTYIYSSHFNLHRKPPSL